MKSVLSSTLAQVLGVCLMLPIFSQAASLKQDYIAIRDSRDNKAVISSQGTGLDQSWIDQGLAPRGSAALTTSGKLADSGIKYIIHAASGAMSPSGDSTSPSIEGVQNSLINALRIADQEGIQRLAVPLIGGGIFLDSLGISKERLAYIVIDTVRSQNAKTQVVFVAYSEDDTAAMQSALEQLSQDQKENMNWLVRLWNYLKSKFTDSSDFFARSGLVRGSITDFNLHKAEAIVNAANMELTFGGGLSGVIGKASQDQEQINETGQRLIQRLYQVQAQ
jgi:O-acetyl-ADP-ribose deacetylase (regulator of RNase III)